MEPTGAARSSSMVPPLQLPHSASDGALYRNGKQQSLFSNQRVHPEPAGEAAEQAAAGRPCQHYSNWLLTILSIDYC